jgi:uncharacterized protein
VNRVDLTSLTRLPELGSTDRAELDALLDRSVIAHVGFAVDGQPIVLPTAIARDGDVVLFHGSTGSRWMRRLAAAASVAVAVTAVDGLVVARSAFESSMHYSSAVIFGTCTALEGEAKRTALDVLTNKLLPGRVSEIRPPTGKELAATLVLAVPITSWSLKVSDGWPEDPPADVEGSAWAGVVPLELSYGRPRSAPDLAPGIPVPRSVSRLSER